MLNVLSFADRFLMQAFAVDIVADLELTNLQFTLLTGLVFTVFYALMGLLMGILADRYSRPRLIAAGLVAWSLLTGVTGAVHNFLQIALARTFIGVGEATLTPAALGLLGDLFPQQRRAFVSGVYYLGAPIGIGGAFIGAGTLGAIWGWRNCFFSLGVLGTVLAIFTLVLREPRSMQLSKSAQIPAPWRLSESIAEIRRVLSGSPTLCLVFLGGLLVIFAQGALVLDQLWLVQERNFAKEQAQKLAGIIFLVGGVIGSVVGGIVGDYMQARRSGGRLYSLTLVYLVGMPIACLYRFADPATPVFYICMLVGSITLTIGYGPLFASVQDLVPATSRSTMIAFFVLCLTLFGTSGGNLLAGWLADWFKSAEFRQPLTWAILLGLTPGLFAIPCFYLAARHLEHAPTTAC
jgi:MFS family permease